MNNYKHSLIKRIIALNFFIFFFLSNSYAQPDINSLKLFTVGKELLSRKSNIDKVFNSKGELFKVIDFSSVYKYRFENTIFSKCENAKIEFLYVYDTLCLSEVEFYYLFNEERDETRAFLQTLEKILSDISLPESGIRKTSYKNSITIEKIKNVIKQIKSSDFHIEENSFKSVFSETDFYNIEFADKKNGMFILDVSIWHGIHSWKGTKPPKSISFKIGLAVTRQEYISYNLKYFGSLVHVDESKSVDLNYKNGVYTIPVELNRKLSLDFVLDLGASDVSISPDVFLVLYKSGTINDTDFIGENIYQLADGSKVKSSVFNLSFLKIGDVELRNVRATISNNINSPLLLGQSALKMLQGYRIDNERRKIIFD